MRWGSRYNMLHSVWENRPVLEDLDLTELEGLFRGPEAWANFVTAFNRITDKYTAAGKLFRKQMAGLTTFLRMAYGSSQAAQAGGVAAHSHGRPADSS